MKIASQIAVVIISILHIYIMIIEMWFWDKPKGLKAFGLNQEFATKTKVMAANQGLYNGFLVAGLLWGLIHQDFIFGLQIQVFFLSCIFIAGIFGAITSSKKILFIQSIPSIIALFLLTLNINNI